MKRLAPALAFAALGTLMIAGCSSPAPSDDPANSSQQPTAKAAEPAEIDISAAASLSDAMLKLQTTYKKEHPEINIVVNYGASGTLQQQIEQGAPADLFLSAGTKQMDALVKGNLVEQKKVKNLLTNDLVLVVPTDAKTPVQQIADLAKPDVKKIALGMPASVPAGAYAQESLTKLGVWNAVQSKVVYAKDVRQVLGYVETGNVDAGLVYKTDALTSKKVKIAATADPSSHAPILYPVGVIKNAPHAKQAEALYDWLSTQEAKDIFSKYGFQFAK